MEPVVADVAALVAVVTTRYHVRYPTGVVATVEHQLMSGTVELLMKEIVVEVLSRCLLLDEVDHQGMRAVLMTLLRRRMAEELRGRNCP